MTDSSSPKCPQCGARLTNHAPAGLCPSCLMALNLKAPTFYTDDVLAAQLPLPPEQIAPFFPQFEILECLGRGGMGVVYKARQKTLGRLVAIKLLAPERVRDPQFADGFTREAQALAALNHPNIVTVHDFGQAGGFYYLLMEFVDGANLRQLLRAGAFTPEEALAIVPPLCEALQFAHDRGIVHRDIKPENVLVDKNRRVKIADFGIARMLGEPHTGTGSSGAHPGNAATRAVGTPGYSAPEQTSDPQRADSRADIYSLGAVFYEMLTGELPGKPVEAPSRKVQIDVRLDEIVLRALEKTPDLRWQSATEFRTQVEAIAASGAGAQAPEDLAPLRHRILFWGLAIAAASFSMNFDFRVWGVVLWIVSATLALAAGKNRRRLAIAKRLVLLGGMVVAAAGIWLAYGNPLLATPWTLAIIAGCLIAIAYCLSCWTDSPPGGRSKPSAYWEAVAVLVLAVGIAAALFVYGQPHLLDRHFLAGSSWAPEDRSLATGSPVVALRPSAPGQAGTFRSRDTAALGNAATLRATIGYAYSPTFGSFRWSGHRVILPPGVADGKFDFLVAAPNHPQWALQREIGRQLGLVAHREVREVDGWVLLASNPNHPKLAQAKDGSSSDNRGDHRFDFTNQPIGDLCDYLEDILGQPVINQTEFTQKYTGTLSWTRQPDKPREQKEIQEALSSQFGLDLVPRREPVEILLVEKAR